MEGRPFKLPDDIEDLRNMPPRLVGEHLMAAGRARRNGKDYDFPGGVCFPIRKFDQSNEDHHPIRMDTLQCFAHNFALILEGKRAYWKVFHEHNLKVKAFLASLAGPADPVFVKAGVKSTTMMPNKSNNGSSSGACGTTNKQNAGQAFANTGSVEVSEPQAMNEIEMPAVEQQPVENTGQVSANTGPVQVSEPQAMNEIEMPAIEPESVVNMGQVSANTGLVEVSEPQAMNEIEMPAIEPESVVNMGQVSANTGLVEVSEPQAINEIEMPAVELEPVVNMGQPIAEQPSMTIDEFERIYRGVDLPPSPVQLIRPQNAPRRRANPDNEVNQNVHALPTAKNRKANRPHYSVPINLTEEEEVHEEEVPEAEVQNLDQIQNENADDVPAQAVNPFAEDLHDPILEFHSNVSNSAVNANESPAVQHGSGMINDQHRMATSSSIESPPQHEAGTSSQTAGRPVMSPIEEVSEHTGMGAVEPNASPIANLVEEGDAVVQVGNYDEERLRIYDWVDGFYRYRRRTPIFLNRRNRVEDAIRRTDNSIWAPIDNRVDAMLRQREFEPVVHLRLGDNPDSGLWDHYGYVLGMIRENGENQVPIRAFVDRIDAIEDTRENRLRALMAFRDLADMDLITIIFNDDNTVNGFRFNFE